MNIIIKHIEIIKRIDHLIRLEATGSPEDFASRLEISKAKLYRIIGVMKKLNAPIEYDNHLESFVYVESVAFAFGFYKEQKNYDNSG
ncbi:hypothetical protein [Aquimarina mytili]|uniref:DNA-binding protein n=1 Tax=Aquimarina mytili TaxID=874423 RepID=A0A937D8N9_9FLAO|nr:hypothetical protein [Aquimarina mytili]MBL0682902.1 hypothetical protein [Aquimarina mytili]